MVLAVKEVWPEALRATCFWHVSKNIKARKNFKKYEAQILGDISILQQSSSLEEFNKGITANIVLYHYSIGCSLLKSHWDEIFVDDPTGLEHCEYIFKQWINSAYYGWFEGLHPSAPSTNNGLERQNRTIKDLHTIRKKLGLKKFLKTAEDIVKCWSTDPDRQVLYSFYKPEQKHKRSRTRPTFRRYHWMSIRSPTNS